MEESTSIQWVKVPEMKIVEFANSIDPDDAAHNEPPHLFSPVFNSQCDFAWTKHYGKFAGINFDVCWFGALNFNV